MATVKTANLDVAVNREADQLITSRLLNWGLWSNIGGFPDLGTPAFIEIMKEYFPQDTRITPNSIDAEHIEEVISSLEVGTRSGIINNGSLYSFVLRLEYLEYDRPRSLKCEHVRRKHGRKCSERTFRYHLHNAKKAVNYLCNPLILPAKTSIVIGCRVD
jgi:hypothetical protein